MSQALDYIREVVKLPASQREVLVPLIAWQLAHENPGFEWGPELDGAVGMFLQSLGDDPSKMQERLQQRLQQAGVSEALLRELQTSAKLPALTTTTFEQRVAPGPGQVRGTMAAISLRTGKQ